MLQSWKSPKESEGMQKWYKEKVRHHFSFVSEGDGCILMPNKIVHVL